MNWREMQQNMGWDSFFVIASTLSLAHALVVSGAAAWFSGSLVGLIGGLSSTPWLFLLGAMLHRGHSSRDVAQHSGLSGPVIPVAMAAGEAVGINPLLCGLLVVVVGDTPVYYPAGATSGVFIFQRSAVRASEVFRFGLIMTAVSIGTLFMIVLPYWRLVGEPVLR